MAAKIYNLQVFYDGLCPLCTKEINHYQKKDKKNEIEFIDISPENFDDVKYGLNGRDYHKIFHVKNKDGQFFTAVDGFVAIWKELNCFKPLTKMAGSKFYRPFFDMGYNIFAKVRPAFRNDPCEDGSCSADV